MRNFITSAALLQLLHCHHNMHVDAFSLTPKQQRMFIPSKIIPSEIQRDLNVQTRTRDEKSKPKTFGQVLLDRSDTLRSAGFYDVNINEESGASSNNQYPPLTAGARTNITLFLVALGYKYYRSIFINKVSQSVGWSNAYKFPNYGYLFL